MPDKNNTRAAMREALRNLAKNKWPEPDGTLRKKVAEEASTIGRPRWLQQPKPEPKSPKRKHKPHKPHKQYQREPVRAILNQIPNWHELLDDDLIDLVEKKLPKEKSPSDKRKTILRAAGRLK